MPGISGCGPGTATGSVPSPRPSCTARTSPSTGLGLLLGALAGLLGGRPLTSLVGCLFPLGHFLLGSAFLLLSPAFVLRRVMPEQRACGFLDPALEVLGGPL